MGGSAKAIELVDLVRGGFRVRMAGRPPARIWVKYAFMNTPVPPRWHGWMHDHLTSRWYPLTSGLPIVLFMALMIAGPDLVNGTPLSPWVVASYVVAAVLGGLVGARWKRPRVQRRISQSIGYDISTDAWRTESRGAPAFSSHGFRPPPATRIALPLYGRPLGLWSLVSGLTLVVGAARPNSSVPDFDSPTFSLMPDTSSPLTSTQVWLALAMMLMAICAVSAVWSRTLVQRSEHLGSTSVHPLNALISNRGFWAISTAPGLCVSVIGLSGWVPDRPSLGVAAAMLLFASLVLVADGAARRCAASVGRPVSMADLIVGERPVSMPPPPTVPTDGGYSA